MPEVWAGMQFLSHRCWGGLFIDVAAFELASNPNKLFGSPSLDLGRIVSCSVIGSLSGVNRHLLMSSQERSLMLPFFPLHGGRAEQPCSHYFFVQPLEIIFVISEVYLQHDIRIT